MKKHNTISIHTCEKITKPHKPELKQAYPTLKEAIIEGKKLSIKYKHNAYINWQSSKRYLISYPELELTQ